MAFNPEEYVYTIDHCDFTLADSAYGVSGIKLFATESGIPTAELIINPKPDANAEDVETLYLSDMMDYISVIQSYANNPEGICTLDLLLTSEAESYAVSMSKWLLVDAGLSTSATGELGCRITMQHPIQAATNSNVVMMNRYKSYSSHDPAVGPHIVSCILKGINYYLDAHDPNKAGARVGEQQGDQEQRIQRIDAYTLSKARASLEVLNKYTAWDYPVTMPFTFTAYERVFRGIGVRPDGYIQEGLSPYHTMMSALDELMVMTRGTFSDDPIVAAPREPWAASTLKFKESEISMVSLPQAPANLISGVAVVGTAETDTYATSSDGLIDMNNPIGLSSNIVARGGYFDKAAYIYGKLYIVNPPFFFTYFGQIDNCTLVLDEQGIANDDKADTTGGQDLSVDVAKLAFSTDIRRAVDAWAHDYFWKVYRSNFALAFRTKFTTEMDGIAVQPGRVCDIVTDDGQTMYTCYIISVNHILSVAGKEAYTDIVGYYARGSTGIKNVLEQGAVEKSWVFGTTAPPRESAK